MRPLRNLVLATAFGMLGTVGLASQASATCEVTGDTFYLHMNDSTRHTAKTDKNGCDLHFISSGKKTRFSSAAIVTKPKNGALHKIAHLEFRYHPNDGFTGSDEFSLKLCGKTPKGKGCSTLNYTAQVN
jgi:hypothetical protein